ncbi:MAG: crossover junction endodeoxyribonuclease RuvC [Phycisphaerales bacterium]|nr:crossover junction endodeoxyribonuclease RuvC [Phycisphaerales bacterium]
MRYLGIDPGLRVTGYACVEERSAGVRTEGAGYWGAPGAGQARLIEAGVLRFRAGLTVADRLVELERDLCELITRLTPSLVAVEKLYAHYNHPTTAIVMGHARGVVLLCTRRAGVELAELGATAVKKSLTGHGHASKSQMQDAVMAQLALASRPEPADVADAIAIALCAARRHAPVP